MDNQEKIAEFVSFCIEQYKHLHNKSGEEVVILFENNSIIEILIEHYEILHTQSKQYILEEIDLILNNRK